MSYCVVLLGPPGAGKGTQAKLLAQVLGVPHVSSGDLFRDHLSRETELGLLAKGYIERGDLVPDDVTMGMVIERLGRSDCREGVILDGFPRTLSQAVALDGALGERGQRVDVVPLVQVRDEKVMGRLTARRTCRNCGAVYNLVFNLPRVEGVCDACGGEGEEETFAGTEGQAGADRYLRLFEVSDFGSSLFVYDQALPPTLAALLNPGMTEETPSNDLVSLVVHPDGVLLGSYHVRRRDGTNEVWVMFDVLGADPDVLAMIQEQMDQTPWQVTGGQSNELISAVSWSWTLSMR